MATIFVDLALDIVNAGDGRTSLREAIIEANTNVSISDTIRFDLSLAGQTIALAGPSIAITSNITIDGDVPPFGAIYGDNKADITIMGFGSQIFDMSGRYTAVNLLSLTLTNGGGSVGGAIRATDIDILRLFDTTIQFSGDYGGRGGAIYASDTALILVNSLLYSNKASEGGAIFSKGGSVYIAGSTIHDNDASLRGGAIHLEQNTVNMQSSSLYMVQSTVTGNSAAADSASATSGGAISTFSFSGSHSIAITNSVVAENTSGNADTLHDVAGTINTANYSVFGSDVTVTAGGNNIESVMDPGLGKLWINGGTVWSRNIDDSSSVLINGGSNASAYSGTDANGAPRISDGIVDVGATEFNGALVVTTELDVVNADDGLLSLREAVAIANGNSDADSITFAVGLAGKSIVLTGGELTIAATVSIDGDVNKDNRADITISGNGATRIFNISGGTTDVDLLSLTLSGGNGNNQGGGAISATGIATLDLVDTTISNNTARIGGGGVFVDGGAVTATRVLLTGNIAFDAFGGLAGVGGGGFGGGIAVQNGSLSLTSSTVHGNTASLTGGGINVSNAPLSLLNSTVTGNVATPNAGFGGAGAGISGADASTTITNSVVAGNIGTSYGTPSDVSGTVGTAGNSVFGSDVAGVTGGSNGNLESVTSLGLGALQDNGGTVMTRSIESSASPLVNAGSNAAAAGLATDANGNVRNSDGTVDIGATEFDGPLVVTTELDVVDASDGLLSLREAVTIANGDGNGDLIKFDATLAGKTIVLTSQLQITSDVTLDGDVNDDFKADITLSGGNANGILRATSAGTDLNVRSLTLTNGAAVYGGAIYAGGGGTLQVSHSTISNSSGSSFGGGIFSFVNTYVTNSTFFGNSAGNGGGGGIYSRYGYVVLMNTTVHDNSTTGLGGGVKSGFGDLLLINSTVAGNQADSDGAQVNAGGGIALVSNTLYIRNSVVATNTSGMGNAAHDVGGAVSSAGNSFFGTTVTIATDFGGNINTGGDPLLGELLDNGGTVLTMSPLDNSPLIGKGSNVFLPFDVFDVDGDDDTTEILPLDGRGGVRILLGTVDIGAVEQFPAELIRGTGGNNTIIGGLGADILFGLEGDDTITGGSANDYVEGGAGADTLDGGAGNGDMLSYAGSALGVNVDLALGVGSGGDAAFDTFINFENVTGSNKADTLFGNTLNNLLQGLNGADVIDGGDGNDTIIGGNGGDTLTGGAGIDTLSYVGSGGVTINLSANTATGSHATGDIISGFENLIGSNGKDDLVGSSGANVIFGFDGADIIRGGNGADTLNGGKGKDTLSYAGSALAVTVNLGANTASGGDADGDVIFGFENLIGSGQADTLTGSNAANVINGAGGADRIDGGGSLDTLTGGGGGDTFVLTRFQSHRDTITDFGLGADLLEIDAAAFGAGLVAGALDPNQFVLGTAAVDADDRFIYDGATGNLFFDKNGLAPGGVKLIATFSNLAVLDASDFVIV